MKHKWSSCDVKLLLFISLYYSVISLNVVHICSPSVCEAVQEDWELEVSTGFIVKYLKKRCKLIWFYNLVLCYVRSNVMSDLIKYGVILTKNKQTDKN